MPGPITMKTNTFAEAPATSAILACLSANSALWAVPAPTWAAEADKALSETATLVSAIFKVMGSLALVVALMLILLYLIKKSGLSQGANRAGSLIKIMETRMVAPKKYIAIVEISGKYLAVGITDHNINMLTELDGSIKEQITVAGQSSAAPATTFAGVLSRALTSFKFKTQPGPKIRQEANNGQQ